MHPRPEDLPEVAELLAAGWRVADQAPMWCFLPAVWPDPMRCWVHDRLPRFSWSGDRSQGVIIHPWTPEVAAEIHRSKAALLERVGLPSPPSGRTWLLRSPWPTIGVERVQALIAQRARELGHGGMLDEALVAAAREVLSWDEEYVWNWWPGAWGDVARAWRARGRVGEDAAAVSAARLDPGLLSEYEARGLGEAAALEWTWALHEYGREGLERALAWIELGLSPSDVGGLYNADPGEVRAWLAEGFDLDEVRILDGLPLQSALAWRAAGIPAGRVWRLLEADHTLSPAEAAAFNEASIEDPVPWVELGFDAAAARAWTDLDVFPNEARVWRAAGHDPKSAGPVLADLDPGVARIPEGTYAVSWTTSGVMFGGRPEELNLRAQYHYSVHDPPGTRGRSAHLPRRSSQHD